MGPFRSVEAEPATTTMRREDAQQPAVFQEEHGLAGRGIADGWNDWSREESRDYRNSERKLSRERTDREQSERRKENSAVYIQGRNREPSGVEEKRRAAWDYSDP
ncbi:hypothetical protein NDU88_007843 [Pleurodeles waltl]|uniref:Uncharacterized protein n=1 Tax=Pleurodeles waltl TaxID=8319 RepID=A0AAV7PR60_PLEWA|nr:hypothetical protein NDU88_007843 [Pleurodeles waltl]